jgi:hypothetical protein
MEDRSESMRAERVGFWLKMLSAIQVTAGVSILSTVLLLFGPERLTVVSKAAGMPGRILAGVAVTLLLLVTVSGLVAFFRIRYGWFFVFFVASILLLMAILQAPGTILFTRASFLVLMALSGVSWALAVVFYLWDLYT